MKDATEKRWVKTQINRLTAKMTVLECRETQKTRRKTRGLGVGVGITDTWF